MDYIIKDKNTAEHYFIRQGSGLAVACEKNMLLPETILPDVKNAFCVYKADGFLHIICVNGKNELVYILKKEEEYKQYILCELKDGLSVGDVKITSSGGRLNLLYSAAFEGEFMLIHCVLGNHALPSVIDKMSDSYFFLFGDRVYYTNRNRTLGYQELTDGKPDHFISIAENAFKPYLCTDNGKNYLVYIKDDTIYVNHIPKYADSEADTPVIAAENGYPTLVWKSGAALKYADISDSRTAPRRVAGTGMPTLYSIQDDDGIRYNYAQKSDGMPYFSEPRKTVSAPSLGSDGGAIINLLAKLKNDISDIEEKLKKLQ